MARVKRTQAANRERALVVFERLKKAYPDARCALNFTNPLELLVATILAAQCTDVRVNQVTKDLFRRYTSPDDYVSAPIKRLQEEIRSCGFYRNKSKSIVNACRAIMDDFDGHVPQTMEALLKLDGVGRKTANVLLGECFNTPGIIVDTHCKRVTHRLGFTRNTDPDKIERDLMRIWPRESWTLFSHCIVFHGRNVCHARGPRCSGCTLADLCPFPTSRAGSKAAK